jgi:uncharacterized protein
VPRPTSLSAAQARRTVLAAQGLATPRPTGRVDRRHMRSVVRRLGLVQIDSVNVLARAHHLPFFSRLGPHDATLLDRLAYRDHELFEYWGHEASLIDVELEPLLRWRMADGHRWSGPAGVGQRRPDLLEQLEALVHEHGPVSAAEVDAMLGTERDRTGPWWGWGDTKKALENLFWHGRVGAVRHGGFERAYCHPAVTVPGHVRARPTPDPDDALRRLVLVAARAHGVATPKDLADYWRLPIRAVRALVPGLVADGELEPVAVEGWSEPALRHPDAALPRRVDACALVSPFDVAMWHRNRVERVHRFRYAIEIYVPEAKRVHGYYVLPFLLGDTYVGRVDLKADRAGRRLLVQSAWAEPDLADRGTDDAEVAERLHGELRLLADWLDLDDVVVVDRGDLAPALAAVR